METMKTTSNFRTRVMKYAWQIFRATGNAWNICMKKAWYVYKLYAALKERVVYITYLKKDGTIRPAVGSLRFEGGEYTKKGKPAYKTLCYYDLEKQGFRSFKIENLIQYQIDFNS